MVSVAPSQREGEEASGEEGLGHGESGRPLHEALGGCRYVATSRDSADLDGRGQDESSACDISEGLCRMTVGAMGMVVRHVIRPYHSFLIV